MGQIGAVGRYNDLTSKVPLSQSLFRHVQYGSTPLLNKGQLTGVFQQLVLKRSVKPLNEAVFRDILHSAKDEHVDYSVKIMARIFPNAELFVSRGAAFQNCVYVLDFFPRI